MESNVFGHRLAYELIFELMERESFTSIFFPEDLKTIGVNDGCRIGSRWQIFLWSWEEVNYCSIEVDFAQVWGNK